MWKSHYLFSNINFNSASALRISILLLSSLKKLIIFFKIKSYIGISNNNIIRINKSMSKNTESIDITNFLQHIYTINNTNIWSDTFDQLAYPESNIKIGDLVNLQCYFSFAKKIERAKVQYSTRIQSAAKSPESANFLINMALCFIR